MNFCANSHRFQDINIYPENLGQSRGLQHLQCRHLMADIRIYKYHITYFLRPTVSKKMLFLKI